MRIASRLRSLCNRIFLNPACCYAFDSLAGPRTLGRRGEIEAERFLMRSGHIVVERGFSDGRGEIDLVAVEGRELVFVEVKTRTSDIAGEPMEAVGEEKQNRIVSTALAFMKLHDLLETECRFDIVAIIWPDERRRPNIQHVRNAFQADSEAW